jgi:2-succinyl-5-enolpyruvyl-6-hydroxy-3-cyclohexene-1-carboxylate synthase
VGAAQTVDQAGMYGAAVRLAVEPGVPRADAAHSWRSVAARAVLATSGSAPGPVHLNLAFAEPLLGEVGPLPEGRGDGRPWHEGVTGTVEGARITELGGRRGVVVAGRGPVDPGTVHDLADVLGWPVLADPLSGARTDRPATIAGFDLLGRCEAWAADHLPEAVVRVGAPPASKVLANWLEPVPVQVVVDPTAAFADPQRVATHLLAGVPDVTGLAAAPPEWRAAWREADDAVQAVLDSWPVLSEPTVARTVLEEASTLVVGSSMPVRDLEWFGATTAGRVVANRGANGIDGVVSTAVGVALAGGPTVGLLGDLSFLHDSNGLLGAADRGLSLTLVVVDNDGGGIFSFLPQATELGPDEFEQLFGTPHRLDLVAVARALGAEAAEVATLDELRKALVPAPGVHVVVVPMDRQANVTAHEEIYARVAEVVGAA